MRNPSAGREVFSGGPRVSAWSAACTKECGMLPHWRNPGKPCFRDKGKTCINTERVNTGETGKLAKLPKTGKKLFPPAAEGRGVIREEGTRPHGRFILPLGKWLSNQKSGRVTIHKMNNMRCLSSHKGSNEKHLKRR